MLKKILVLPFVLAFVICFSACSKREDESTVSLSSSYDISATLDAENQVLYTTTKVSIFNDTEKDLSELSFYLYPSAYKNCRVDVGGIKCNGTDLEFTLDGINLSVRLSTPLKNGESSTYIIGTRTSVPSGNDRFGLTEDGVYNLHAFFPRLAYYEDGFAVVPYSDRGDPYLFAESDFNLRLEAPIDYVVAHSGELIGEECGESSKVSTVFIEDARDIALSLSKDFKVTSGEICGVKISYYGEEDSAESVEFIAACIEGLNNLIGEYPYASFSVAESDFRHGGMEYSAFTLINKSSSDKKFVILHELLHQWFGLKVGSNGYAEGWLDESLVNYLTYYYMDIYNNGGYDQNVSGVRGSYDRFLVRRREELGSGYSPRINVTLADFRDDDEYAYVVYDYGTLIYDGISQVVGKDKLIKGIKGYYSEMKGKVATENDLIKCFEKHGTKKIGGVIRAYLNNKVIG